MRFLLPFLAVCSSTAAYTCSGHHKTVSLQWSLGWKWISPDGYGRPVVAVNNLWPPPTIDMCKGDRLALQITNNLGNETTSIHFHGFYQNGENQMDGPAMVTQCPIPPGSIFTYNFTVSFIFLFPGDFSRGRKLHLPKFKEQRPKTSCRLDNKSEHIGGTAMSTARLLTACEVP